MDEEQYEETFEQQHNEIPNYKGNEKKSRSKNWATALLLSLLAIMIGSAIAVGAGRKFTQNIELEASTVVTTPIDTTKPRTSDMTKEAAADVTGVPDERTTVPQTVTANRQEKYIFPLDNNIIKDYSNGVAVKSNTLGDWRTHNGIDFTAKLNDNVKAVKSGSVTAVYYDKLWGNVVEIDHGDSVVAKYCGLKEGTTAKVGDILEQGETVGAVGIIPCESADEPHLHFEVKVAGKTVDPVEAMGIGY